MPPNRSRNMITAVELMDRFQVLLQQESTIYMFDDYLTPSFQLATCHRNGESHFTEQEAKDLSEHKMYWRSKLCAWMYSIIDNHGLDRELVSIAMSYMDRYLSECWTKHFKQYQLVAMTSLYLAMKLYRDHGRCAGIDSFVKLSKGAFSEEDFTTMEQSMLSQLGWCMHPPTSVAYLELLIHFLPRGACSSVMRMALFERIKFLLELSSTVQFFFAKKPSSIAIAAAIEVIEHDEAPHISERKYQMHFKKFILSIGGVDYEAGEVLECREAMKVVYRDALCEFKAEMDMSLNCLGATQTTSPKNRVVSP